MGLPERSLLTGLKTRTTCCAPRWRFCPWLGEPINMLWANAAETTERIGRKTFIAYWTRLKLYWWKHFIHPVEYLYGREHCEAMSRPGTHLKRLSQIMSVQTCTAWEPSDVVKSSGRDWSYYTRSWWVRRSFPYAIKWMNVWVDWLRVSQLRPTDHTRRLSALVSSVQHSRIHAF